MGAAAPGRTPAVGTNVNDASATVYDRLPANCPKLPPPGTPLARPTLPGGAALQSILAGCQGLREGRVASWGQQGRAGDNRAAPGDNRAGLGTTGPRLGSHGHASQAAAGGPPTPAPAARRIRGSR